MVTVAGNTVHSKGELQRESNTMRAYLRHWVFGRSQSRCRTTEEGAMPSSEIVHHGGKGMDADLEAGVEGMALLLPEWQCCLGTAARKKWRPTSATS